MIKKFIFVFMLIGSFCAFAGVECFVVTKSGAHIDFNESSGIIDSMEPFGLIRVSKANGRYHLSTMQNGEETIVSFKKKVTITKQTPFGISGGIGSLTCM